MEGSALVWLRDDLRLGDNPALSAAANTGRPVLAVYVFDEVSPGLRPLGGASKWWLAQSLRHLAAELARIGGALHLFSGAAGALIPSVARQSGCVAAFWNRRYLQAEIAVDRAVEDSLRGDGIRVESFAGKLEHEPWQVVPKAGGFYHVYSPYRRAAAALGNAEAPLPAPVRLLAADLGPAAPRPVSVEDLGLEPRNPDWAAGFKDAWHPGEASARRSLKNFVEHGLDRYGHDRDSPALSGSSRLSPHLRFGELSARQVMAAARQRSQHSDSGGGSLKFMQEVAWRDFAYTLLHNLPNLSTRPYDPRFEHFPYAELAPETLRAWQFGNTGYPFVDAGMRQLWNTGTMHNRVRMATASFLVKHLLGDWRIGEAWFWDTLCDADPANNAVNWQWVAGCGPDAAPFFRIFNPVLQSRKFDPNGDYIRRFVPELRRLDRRSIHAPWEAPTAVLKDAGVALGTTYPMPIVDHAQARARALAAYATLRQATSSAARA